MGMVGSGRSSRDPREFDRYRRLGRRGRFKAEPACNGHSGTSRVEDGLYD
jgi:hypothetical protein